jgi:metal-sulfur cluster biosynthetic enzyme
MSPGKSQNPARQAVWQIESTHPDKADTLDQALREIIDPEIGLNIMELGLVRDILIEKDGEDETAHMVMIMTTPFCPYAPAILESSRSAVETTLGLPTTIELGTEFWDPTYMEEGTGGDWGLF